MTRGIVPRRFFMKKLYRVTARDAKVISYDSRYINHTVDTQKVAKQLIVSLLKVGQYKEIGVRVLEGNELQDFQLSRNQS